MTEYLHHPVMPFRIVPDASVRDVLHRMGRISFQGRNLSEVVRIWEEMLSGDITIMLGLAGAMVPAGMRQTIAFLIEHRFIDGLVSTGANLFHDCHETLGYVHWQGNATADDVELYEQGIDRIYDTFAKEEEFRETDRYIGAFSRTLETRPYSTAEFLRLLGERLREDAKESGILTAAARAGVPIYCPAIADSSLGIAVAAYGPDGFLFDILRDVKETACIVAHAEDTGVIYIGGGTPKNFIQQTEVTASVMGWKSAGHRYAVQVTADAPHWGGLSGCTFEEAQSWGKISGEAEKATVFADATLVLPLIVTALAQSDAGQNRAERVRQRPLEDLFHG